MQKEECKLILWKNQFEEINILNIDIKIIKCIIENVDIYIDIYEKEVYDIKHKEENKCIK